MIRMRTIRTTTSDIIRAHDTLPIMDVYILALRVASSDDSDEVPNSTI